MVSGEEYARQAKSTKYDGLTYDKADCQKFVELVLIDCGVKKPDGKPYDWEGSNSMWRNALAWKGTIEECKKKYGEIPLGAFLFLLKWDGKEAERGYHDGLGNATHVGLYVGTAPLPVMDSQPTGGVQYRKLSIFTHVGLMDMIDYYNEPEPAPRTELNAVRIIRNADSTDEEVLEALKTLTKYLKGVTL